jgi:hypothetical protein
MFNATSLKHSPTAEAIVEATVQIRDWAYATNLSTASTDILVQCLDSKFLLSLRRPTTKYRRGSFTAEQNHRYLWYRKAAELSGWKVQRQKFPSAVEEAIRRVWCDEEREEGMRELCSSRPAEIKSGQRHGGHGTISGDQLMGHVPRAATDAHGGIRAASTTTQERGKDQQCSSPSRDGEFEPRSGARLST